MDFISSAILSGVLYDMLKSGGSLCASEIKTRLTDWIVDDEVAKQLADRMKNLQIDDGLSEKAIQKRIEQSDDILNLLEKIQPKETSITQTHHGSGDNVGRDKIVHK